MQVTVIGIYENLDEARETEGELENEGFSAQDISIADENQARVEEHGIKRFFRDILGLDDEAPPAGATTTVGQYILTLYADDARAQAAAQIMNRHHPVLQRISTERDVTPETEPVRADSETDKAKIVESIDNDVSGASTESLGSNLRDDGIPRERLGPEDGAIGSVQQSFGAEALDRQPYEELRREQADALLTDEYRAHFDESYGATGIRFDEVLVAYQFGARLVKDSRFRGGTFDDFEGEIRRAWEATNPASPWERFKGAIRHAWERGTNKAV